MVWRREGNRKLVKSLAFKLVVMRAISLSINQLYHVYNRGVDKRKVFLNRDYYSHFTAILEHCLQFNYPYSLLTQQLVKAHSPKAKRAVLATLERRRIDSPVQIISFCLMPNHFHLTLKQVVENGITDFMHRIGTAFTKYFNLRQRRTGRLFEGSFKAVLIETEEQLIHLSRYQHINPAKLGYNLGDLIDYPWSSLSTYIRGCKTSNFKFVDPKPTMASFNSPKDYLEFVKAEVDDFEPARLDRVAIDDDFGWFNRFRQLERDEREEFISRVMKAKLKA